MLLHCAVEVKYYLQYIRNCVGTISVQSIYLRPPYEANLLLCHYSNTFKLLGINDQDNLLTLWTIYLQHSETTLGLFWQQHVVIN